MSPSTTKTAGLIRSRPKAQKNLGSTTTGLRQMGLETERDGFLYVPESFNPKKLSPLLVVFHAASGTAQQSVDAMKKFADATGTILVAPQSQDDTWDAISNDFGQDVELVDEALSDVFALYPIDPARVAAGGFADGAKYAVQIANANSDLFSHIIAFAPGIEADVESKTSTPVYISKAVPENEKAFHWFLGSSAN